jgi:DNA-directed RNA polymerase subunit RPC12/RpoP
MMDRIALSERFEGLAGIFSDESKIAIDLRAMAHVLREANDESFTQILNPKFSSEEVEAKEDKEAILKGVAPHVETKVPGSQRPRNLIPRKLTDQEKADLFDEMSKGGFGQQAKKFLSDMLEKMQQGGMSKGATEEVESSEESQEVVDNYWNKEANDAVAQNLLRNIMGMEKSICCDTKRKLTPDQTPDGKHGGVPKTPETLKKDQTPDQVDDLDSNMVEKSKGKVKKEAGKIKGPGKPDGTGPYGDTEECPKSGKKEATEEKEAAETFKCPGCGGKVLAKTGYCVKCKTKVKPSGKKAAEESKEMEKKEMKAIKDIAKAIESLKELEKKEEEMGMGEPEHEEAEKEILDDMTENVQKLEDLEKEEGGEEAEDTDKMKEMEAAKKTASTQPTMVVAEGIELSGGDTMDDIDLGSPEIQKLSTLFN